MQGLCWQPSCPCVQNWYLYLGFRILAVENFHRPDTRRASIAGSLWLNLVKIPHLEGEA